MIRIAIWSFADIRFKIPSLRAITTLVLRKDHFPIVICCAKCIPASRSLFPDSGPSQIFFISTILLNLTLNLTITLVTVIVHHIPRQWIILPKTRPRRWPVEGRYLVMIFQRMALVWVSLAHFWVYTHTKPKHRSRQARSMAFTIPGLVEASLLQGPKLDQDHQ